MSKKNKIIIIIVSCVFIILLSLAIIIPIIIKNNIEKEKQQDLKYVKTIVDAVKKNCNEELSSEEKKVTLKYTIKENKLYTGDNVESTLKINAALPDNGIIEIDNECNITLSVIYGEYSIVKKSDKDASIVEHNVYSDGDIIYFNPETKKVCTDYKEENSNDSVKNGCMKWYAFNDAKKNNTLKLILDHNTTSNTSFVTSNDYKQVSEDEFSNKKGPVTVLKKLSADTSSWVVEAKLLTIEDISNMLDINIDLNKNEDVFFSSKESKPLKSCYKGDTTNCKYSFLTDRANKNCKEYGCNANATTDTYGYWTSSVSSKDTLLSWRVYFDGRITLTNINDVSSGIRPVIEIQKSLLK